MGTVGRLIVGLTGASAPILAIRTLQALRASEIETHLVISRGARRTLALEEPAWGLADVEALADFVHRPEDMAAPIASGSFRVRGMVVVPCSMNTLSHIAHSATPDLVARAADVTLKERRRLVLVPRESPLHLGHLRNLLAATELGAIAVPPVIGTYYKPHTVLDVVDHVVGRVLDLFDIEHDLVNRWNGPPQSPGGGM
ncbi:UbiX family flavin prenyltransferase [Nocardia sp. NPDC049190]|uniref:UbiX family flavin prenyltransferase n=1 Tax=Nocardia sp. NPDC049190 TaxID=3155650 RepID=UPI0033E515A3